MSAVLGYGIPGSPALGRLLGAPSLPMLGLRGPVQALGCPLLGRQGVPW